MNERKKEGNLKLIHPHPPPSKDELCPLSLVEAAHEKLRDSELVVLLACSHFGLYFDPAFDPAVEAMVGFLKRELALV